MYKLLILLFTLIFMHAGHAQEVDPLITAVETLTQEHQASPEEINNAELYIIEYIKDITHDKSNFDTDRFEQVTNYNQLVGSLPWSVSGDIYKLIKTGTILFQLSDLAVDSSISALESTELLSLNNMNVATGGAFSGQLIANATKQIYESSKSLWELKEIKSQFDELFNSKPGNKIDILGADYLPFAMLFKEIEIIKLLSYVHSDKNSAAADKLTQLYFSESLLSLARVSRQIAGLKKVIAGDALALNLEAQVASAISELAPLTRNLLVQHWAENNNVIVKKLEGWLTGDRKTMTVEIESFLEDLKSAMEIVDQFQHKTKSQVTVKSGFIALGILQQKFKTADLALSYLESSNDKLISMGLENSIANKIVGPIAESSTWIKSGINMGASWTINSFSFTETMIVSAPELVSNAVVSSFNSVVDLGSKASQTAQGLGNSAIASSTRAANTVTGAIQDTTSTASSLATSTSTKLLNKFTRSKGLSCKKTID